MDETSSQVAEVETNGDVDDEEDEATVEVKDEEKEKEEEKMGIFRSLLSLLRFS